MVGNALRCHGCLKPFLKLRKCIRLGELKSVDSKISMKTPNAVGNFRRSYSCTKLCRLMDGLFQRSNQSKHIDLCENSKKKTTRYYKECSTIIQRKLQW